MDKETAKYVFYYITGLICGFAILSISALFTAAGIMYGVAYFHKINM